MLETIIRAVITLHIWRKFAVAQSLLIHGRLFVGSAALRFKAQLILQPASQGH